MKRGAKLVLLGAVGAGLYAATRSDARSIVARARSELDALPNDYTAQRVGAVAPLTPGSMLAAAAPAVLGIAALAYALRGRR